MISYKFVCNTIISNKHFIHITNIKKKKKKSSTEHAKKKEKKKLYTE